MRLNPIVIPFPDPLLPGVLVPELGITVYYELAESGIQIKRIAADDITSTTLRSIRIGDLRASIHQMLKDDPSAVGGPAFMYTHGFTGTDAEMRWMGSAHIAAVRSAEILKVTHPKRGRAVDNQDVYGHAARVYLDMLGTHGQKTPSAMAEEFDVPIGTVRTWIRRAREEGWLTPGQQGRAGASPGPRLLRWLDEQEGTTG